ncbi:2-phosphoglycerate kinase [Streptosporangium album]|uniref:2-phosphoglycerate kinase n=1 Tax=Streptosporangium album TaxID=47479 RepID=A0A7W7WEW6_9ACTN|nr:AAA family ATPase [Streptosporangium album]MBB4943799.1 2-phosphoglycerate kinase [Streptosporangium album]
MLLLCGASGTGKSQVSYPLARHHGIPIVEVDDLVEALQAMTTPEQQPLLHHWRTHPEAARLPPDDIADLQIAIAEALVPAVDAIVGNHLETDTPVVIEGDYLLPALAVRDSFAGVPADGRVAAVVLHEPDEAQLVENYRRREPDHGEQLHRARVSALYGGRLAAQAAEVGVPVVTARPWDDVLGRVVAALGARAVSPS